MSKIIEFIAPVNAMRGNLSGRQTLLYAERNNPAWEAPQGVNAARNYTPRYVGAKVAKTGRKLFSVRKKSVVNITSSTKKAMALLAGSAACLIAASKNLAILTELQHAFAAALASNPTLTWRKWLQPILYSMLASKATHAKVTSDIGTVKIGNPWVNPAPGETDITALTIPQKDLVKFWPQLATNPVGFILVSAGGVRVSGIAHTNTTWETLCEDAQLNVLGLVVEGDGVKYGDLYILDAEGDHIDYSSYILPKAYNLGV